MSKGLEALKDLKNAFIGHCRELKCETNYMQVCENKFSKIEKDLKALEIIKEKQIDVLYLMHCETLEEYNDDVLASCAYDEAYAEPRMLIQEECDLLNEVLL